MKMRRRKEPAICLTCKNSFHPTYASTAKYCSNKCQMDFEQDQYIKNWLSGLENGLRGKEGISMYIRRYLFEKYDSKCQQCGWGKINPSTQKIPLTINHIDGNYLNNRPENLELICPNCHSLTENYGILNKGSGRKERKLKRAGIV